MHRDEETHLRSAFSELHRQQRAEAPDFETMRQRALGAANARETAPHVRVPWLRWAACGAAACGLFAIGLWLHGPTEPAVQAIQSAGTAGGAARVDALIDRIEQHVEFHSATALPEYPSDLLLPSLSPASAL